MRGREGEDKMGWVHHIGQCFTNCHRDLDFKRITLAAARRTVECRNGSSPQAISVVQVRENDDSN